MLSGTGLIGLFYELHFKAFVTYLWIIVATGLWLFSSVWLWVWSHKADVSMSLPMCTSHLGRQLLSLCCLCVFCFFFFYPYCLFPVCLLWNLLNLLPRCLFDVALASPFCVRLMTVCLMIIQNTTELMNLTCKHGWPTTICLQEDAPQYSGVITRV